MVMATRLCPLEGNTKQEDSASGGRGNAIGDADRLKTLLCNTRILNSYLSWRYNADLCRRVVVASPQIIPTSYLAMHLNVKLLLLSVLRGQQSRHGNCTEVE